jgi:hypothetical protein
MLAPAQTLPTERRPLAALSDCVEPWRRLAAHAAEPNVFYEPGFALAAAPALGRDVEARCCRRSSCCRCSSIPGRSRRRCARQ